MHQPKRRPASIEAIKRAAKALKKEKGIQHSEALNEASREYGFDNFRHAQNVLPRTGQGDGAVRRFPLTLCAYWYERESRTRGRESLTIELSARWNDLIAIRQLDDARGLVGMRPEPSTEQGDRTSVLSRQHSYRDQAEARAVVCMAARTLQFIDATRLRPSSGRRRAYPNGRHPSALHIPRQDHTDIWMDAEGRYLVTDEPYSAETVFADKERIAWGERYGFSFAKPSWAGMHAPYGGTGLILGSRNDTGVPLEPIVAALAALPAPTDENEWSGESTSFVEQARA
ncbi:hypothetical protein LA345_39825 (plasmid) [Burkholderia vietnamiensis]|uniref:DUF5623 domain-containing protein n=1 Tax=Burkholderia vietnamiensis (strain G4 / LMG 22486) TaxID=269482 RepID=A4JUE3_BURVG|nr:conserved hypothetical protein [Burkholderia vietnamiensis G4]MCB4349941.1 hypothetical protein [Burkholderia vietnamiensis]